MNTLLIMDRFALIGAVWLSGIVLLCKTKPFCSRRSRNFFDNLD